MEKCGKYGKKSFPQVESRIYPFVMKHLKRHMLVIIFIVIEVKIFVINSVGKFENFDLYII